MSSQAPPPTAGALVASSSVVQLGLPYAAKSAAWRAMSGHGRCIQGVNGASTHKGTLAYSFDFKLAVGTPVLAARCGRVAAVVSHFSGGGARAHLAPRANYLAVRHDDGSYGRYYHLRHKGAFVSVGDRVEKGQCLAASGNTGYTGGPHLHFDVVNVLPEETSVLTVYGIPDDFEALDHLGPRLHLAGGGGSLKAEDELCSSASSRCGDPFADDQKRSFPSIAAAFSCELPQAPRRARLRYFPNDLPWESIATTNDFVALADRDASQSFAERVAALADLGASAVVIANSRAGPELFAMGGCEEASKVPAVLVSKETGHLLKKRAAKAPLFVEISAHAAVRGLQPLAEQISLPTHRNLFSFKYGQQLRYVTRTLPVTFRHSRSGFVPQQRKIYPPVLKVPSCRLCRVGGDDDESRDGVLEAVPSLDSSSSLGDCSTPLSTTSSSASSRAKKFKKKKVYQQKTRNAKKSPTRSPRSHS